MIPHRPDLFYAPKQRRDFNNKIVVDPRSISQVFSPREFEHFFESARRRFGFSDESVTVLDGKNAGSHGNSTMPGQPRYVVRDIFEYTDIIHSAEHFLVTESGGQSLAAAVRSKNTHVLISLKTFDRQLFVWPEHQYTVNIADLSIPR
jgi:hypothetical protein